MRRVDIETLADFDRLAADARTMDGWQVQGLDLTGRTEVLESLNPRGALFLGDTMEAGVADSLRSRGALVFPSIPDLDFEPYRGQLYSTDELYAGLDDGYETTPDARIYAWHQRTNPHGTGGSGLRETLAMSLHDNSIDDALAEWVDDRRIVGVMGGHAIERGSQSYRAAARLGQRLADAGVTVATGGGPGAMEAANLGAAYDGADLEAAVSQLGAVPSFRPSIDAWARSARDLGVKDRNLSLGIPTWYYGHEPPNLFCSGVAKYFRNAIREDTLLRVCNGGVVFLPGAAGTVQEIFQDACDNYYSTAEQTAPMVLVGKAYWTETLPAWQLLSRLAVDRAFARRIHLVDSPEDALGLLGDEG